MKKLLLVLFLFAGTAYSQSECSTSPEKCVLITREAAVRALQDSDRVKALEKENLTLTEALNAIKVELNKIRVEYAEKVGENTALKQNAINDRAIIEILLKSAKPKKFGLINF
jgi:hypothetical protein